MIIQIDTEKLNLLKLTPDQYVMLYYLNNKLDCIISPQMKSELEKLQFIDTDGNITLLGKSIFVEEKKDTIDDLLKKMIEYFPKGVKSGGLPVRSSIDREVKQKIEKFRKEYDYSDDTIINACKKYSEDRKKEGYTYMKVFKYFIGKRGEGSLLADYCSMILEGDDTTKKLSDFNIKLDNG